MEGQLTCADSSFKRYLLEYSTGLANIFWERIQCCVEMILVLTDPPVVWNCNIITQPIIFHITELLPDPLCYGLAFVGLISFCISNIYFLLQRQGRNQSKKLNLRWKSLQFSQIRTFAIFCTFFCKRICIKRLENGDFFLDSMFLDRKIKKSLSSVSTKYWSKKLFLVEQKHWIKNNEFLPLILHFWNSWTPPLKI